MSIDNISHLAVCGDSFAVGAGMQLDRCFEDSFGGVVAERLQVPLKVYARSGACNFLIYLQVKKVAEQSRSSDGTPLVLINLTSYSRIFFPYDSREIRTSIDLGDVDYHSYHPYHDRSKPKRPLEFTPSDKPNFTSETISNVGLKLHGNMESLTKMSEVSKRKWQAISMYFEELYDDAVKMETDAALAAAMHLMLENEKIPHIFLGIDQKRYPLVPKDMFLEVNWHDIGAIHPDPAKTFHCNATGHGIVADSILQHLGC